MARLSKLIDAHVVVLLRPAGDLGAIRTTMITRTEAEIKSDVEELARQIKLRVSKYEDNRGDVRVKFDYEHSCEHCGCIWTEEDPNYNGGCCEADENNSPTRTSTGSV